MKASRKTLKLVMAARIVAEIYEERMAQILDVYNAKEVYDHMKSMNYYWDKNIQTWQMRGVPQEQQLQSTRTPVRASIRVMCDDRVYAEAVRHNLMEMIENAGGSIEHVGGIADNHGNSGARAYFEILI